jgi:hypothetical protein
MAPPLFPSSGRPYNPVVTLNGWSLPWRMNNGWKEFHLIAEPVVRQIAPGMDADIVIFDPNRSFTFSTDTSFMNVDYDLWEGKTVAGSARTTLSRGTVVFDDGKIVSQRGHGRFVKRAPFDPALQGDLA